MRLSTERGLALVVAMFMVLMVTALSAAMVHVARVETQSSTNYAAMSQARYAAESGVAAAARYLLSTPYDAVAPGSGGDPLSNYNLSVSPVTRTSGGAVLLSSDPGMESNYPVAAVVTAFREASSGTLSVTDGTVAYRARARLLGMRQITDGITGLPRVLQTWEITGIGTRGAGIYSGEVEVTAIIDRGTRPVYNYAAFATANGCNALTLSGNTSTGSYDSNQAPPGSTPPPIMPSGGNLGTNGNLGQVGSAIVNGTLSTPQTGVGACTANNVTAATLGNESSVSGGLVRLPQPVEYPTPPPPSVMPPTTAQSMNGACPAIVGACANGSGWMTINPIAGQPVVLGNVSVGSNTILTLNPGTYIFNSLTINGGARIVIPASASGNVNIILAGADPVTKVLDVAGNGIGNLTWDPQKLRIEYAGTKTIDMAGTGNTAAIIYAPRAHAEFSGTANFYGSVITHTMSSTGTAGIYYDRRLQFSAITAGNPVMTTFSWSTF